MPWKPASLSDLERENHALQMALLKLRQQLTSKQTYAERLEFLLKERLAKIDAQAETIDQLRQRVQRLDQECEHWCQLVAQSAVLTTANAEAALSLKCSILRCSTLDL
jgi:regulator of replication initiation timing